MPHLSPMQWSTMFISLWSMLTLIMINMFFMKSNLMTINKSMNHTKTLKWKWQ